MASLYVTKVDLGSALPPFPSGRGYCRAPSHPSFAPEILVTQVSTSPTGFGQLKAFKDEKRA